MSQSIPRHPHIQVYIIHFLMLVQHLLLPAKMLMIQQHPYFVSYNSVVILHRVITLVSRTSTLRPIILQILQALLERKYCTL